VLDEESVSLRNGNVPLRRPLFWILRFGTVIFLFGILYFFWEYWDQERFEEWKSGANPFVFFTLLAVLPLLLVPATPFFVVAGAVFPTWVALVGCAGGVAVNCLLNFGLARTGLLRWMRRYITRSESALLRNDPKRTLHFAILIKLAPGLPTVVKNSILALSGIPFRWYFLLSWGMSMVYAVALIVVGESIVEKDFAAMVPAIISLILLSVAVVLVRRWLAGKK